MEHFRDGKRHQPGSRAVGSFPGKQRGTGVAQAACGDQGCSKRPFMSVGWAGG